jgi:hypothetical protein
MNTKLLMTASGLALGLSGLFALFAPDVLLETLGASATTPLSMPLSIPVQLMGSLYFAFALVNWTAKDSAIGGIYARPVSLGNFSHFFVGALILIKYFLSNTSNLVVLLIMMAYILFAIAFYWLVFRATGLPKGK